MAKPDTSRRLFMSGAAVAAAAAAATTARAQQMNPPGAPTAPNAADYPKPPFPVQRQEWPGLAAEMNPRP
ncbi:MAG: NAD(P)-dependent oxidoreductase, partial [Brevundimonas sp.]